VVVTDPEEQLRSVVPPVANEPASESIVGVLRSLCEHTGPLETLLVDPEAAIALWIARATASIDANWLPGGVEVDVLVHDHGPCKVSAEVEDLILVFGAADFTVRAVQEALDARRFVRDHDSIVESGSSVVGFEIEVVVLLFARLTGLEIGLETVLLGVVLNLLTESGDHEGGEDGDEIHRLHCDLFCLRVYSN